MDTSNQEINLTISKKFKQGCVWVFKKWSALRMALDNNPQVLTYFNENQSVLELNEILDILYNDIFEIVDNTTSTTQEKHDLISDNLFDFISDYFQIELQDGSDSEVAFVLIKWYTEIKEQNDEYLTMLLKDSLCSKKKKYAVEFPIISEQKVIFEKENEDEDDEEEEGEGEGEKGKCVDLLKWE